MIARGKGITQTLSIAAFWVGAVGLALFTAHSLTTDIARTLAVAGIAVTAVVVAAKPMLGLIIILLLPVLGEFARLPVGPENGILVSDIFIPVYLALWLAKKIAPRVISEKQPLSHILQKDSLKLYVPLCIFTVVGAFSLIQALLFLTPQEVGASSLYLIRYIAYLLLYFATFDTISSERGAKNLAHIFILSAVLITITGFVQLAIYPDLADLEEAGWDPHINRLVGTWLDPNFVGGLLAINMTIILGLLTHAKKWLHKFLYLLPLGIMGAGLFLTYSRSAYLAFAAGLTVVSLLKSRKILVIALALSLVLFTFSDRARDRMEELGRSVSSVFTTSSETPDPTARLRLESWEQSWQLFLKRPLFGNGFNTLRYVNYREGFVTDTKIHSASGSDSSLLTILATTGIAGFLAFLALQFKILAGGLKNFLSKKNSPFMRGYSVGLFGALLGLLVHSVFVNSLLFPQILSFLWPQIGILAWIGMRDERKNY